MRSLNNIFSVGGRDLTFRRTTLHADLLRRESRLKRCNGQDCGSTSVTLQASTTLTTG